MPSHDTTPLLSFLVPRNFLQLVVWVSYIAHFIVIFFCPFFNSWIFFLDFFFLCNCFYFFSPNCLPFHCLQFLSSLPQYSWLYLLSDYLNSFLAVNFLGNSSFLNVSSLCSCLATSSISCWYSFSNSSIASFAFFKFFFPFYVFDSAVNPFQYTRYLFFPLICCLFKILFISYSSSSLIIIGASCSFFCPSTCFMYLRILLTFTTRCIFTILGSSNSTVFGNMIFLIL